MQPGKRFVRTEKEWVKAYEARKAYWESLNGIPPYHAELTSGNHSNGLFNSRLIIPEETLLREAAHDLVEHFIIRGGNIYNVDRVVGPGTGATKLAEFICDELRTRGNSRCKWSSPTKIGDGDGKQMVFDDPRRSIRLGETILLCDDVFSTGSSINLTTQAVIAHGGIDLNVVLVLVNRSGHTEVGGKSIIGLIERHLPMWTPTECPLCAAESKPIRPKGEAGWALLTGI